MKLCFFVQIKVIYLSCSEIHWNTSSMLNSCPNSALKVTHKLRQVDKSREGTQWIGKWITQLNSTSSFVEFKDQLMFTCTTMATTDDLFIAEHELQYCVNNFWQLKLSSLDKRKKRQLWCDKETNLILWACWLCCSSTRFDLTAKLHKVQCCTNKIGQTIWKITYSENWIVQPKCYFREFIRISRRWSRQRCRPKELRK